MQEPAEEKTEFVVIDDYGTGGVWGMIAAESAAAITSRYPQLRVVTIGDPDWVTPEKHAEIVSDWIMPDEHFDIDRPTGWLLQWNDRLSAGRAKR
jgi:hypothetical protein